jgi:glycosyltransferase involved in cell wall biosynthesis
MVAREAMAYGRPVVTTGVGGLADLGDGAITVAPDGLRAAIERLLADPAARSAAGAAARATAAARFSRGPVAHQLVAAYEAVTRS